MDMARVAADEALRLYAQLCADEPEVLEGASWPLREAVFFRELVQGVCGNLGDLDGLVQAASRNWRLERMPLMDRNILRMAAWEMRCRPDIPGRVSINEAIELAKLFGTVDSAAFVNGVLDRILSSTPAVEGTPIADS